MTFEVAIYTDCAADESVSGRTGFQFMAESGGVTPTDEEFVKNGGLHVVPTDLNGHEPETHPPTCIYRERSGRVYLSRGRSTGQTLSGRPGNQLTQTIIGGTADVLPLRPAQLFSCPQWQLERIRSKKLDPWQTPLEIDPAFETAALHQMVTQDAWVRELLPEFLTMVELATAADRTKLIIKHPDQQLVMRWIALASLFVDSSAAVQLTFRAFSAHPTSDPLTIVGAHPLLSPELNVQVATDNNQHFVDLKAQSWTRVPVSPSAALRAGWFLGPDPFEALEAIETSDRWRTVVDPAIASTAAALACLPHEGKVTERDQEAAALTIAGLAKAGRADELEGYGDALAEVVVTYAAPTDVDLSPAVDALWALDGSSPPTLRATLALAVLDWATEPSTAARWARLHAAESRSENQSIEWADVEDQAHASTVLASILTRAESVDLPSLLTLAKALNTGVRADALSDPIERLARLWAGQPALSQVAYSWLHREFVIERLQIALSDALAARERTALQALTAGEWDWMIPVPWSFDPRDPLAVWLGARVLAKAPAEMRQPLLRELAASAPTDAWALYVDLSHDEDYRELIIWVSSHPRLDPLLADRVEDALNEDLDGKASGRTRDLLNALAGMPPAGLTPVLGRLVEKHGRLRRLWDAALGSARSPMNRDLRELAEVEPVWLRMHRPSLVRCLLECDDRDAVFALTHKVQIDKSLENDLVPRLRHGDIPALAGALRLLKDGEPGHQRVVNRCLNLIWDSSSPTDQSVREQLRHALPAAWRTELAEFEKQQARGRVTRDLTRGARDFFDRKRGS